MNRHKIIASIFVIIALALGIVFSFEIRFPDQPGGYFASGYYNQFGPLALAIELFIAGIYLYMTHKKANFTLALFGFTAILDPIFNYTGILSSLVPTFATVIFLLCAIVALWLAFTDTFNLGKISATGAVVSFVLGTAFELFFYYI